MNAEPAVLLTSQALGSITQIVLNLDDHLHTLDKDFTPELREARDSLYEEARRLEVMPRQPMRESNKEER